MRSAWLLYRCLLEYVHVIIDLDLFVNVIFVNCRHRLGYPTVTCYSNISISTCFFSLSIPAPNGSAANATLSTQVQFPEMRGQFLPEMFLKHLIWSIHLCLWLLMVCLRPVLATEMSCQSYFYFQIIESEMEDLRESRELLERIERRELYKCVAQAQDLDSMLFRAVWWFNCCWFVGGHIFDKRSYSSPGLQGCETVKPLCRASSISEFLCKVG